MHLYEAFIFQNTSKKHLTFEGIPNDIVTTEIEVNIFANPQIHCLNKTVLIANVEYFKD